MAKLDSIRQQFKQVDHALFAVLDSARIPNLWVHIGKPSSVGLVSAAPAAPLAASLFDRTEADDLSDVAPQLVAVGGRQEIIDWILEDGWGRSWGVFLTSERPLLAVADHLRSLAKVRTEDNEIMFFRFYDPRVLRVFLPTCSAAERKEFFGPVIEFWIEGEDTEEALVFHRDRAEPRVIPVM